MPAFEYSALDAGGRRVKGIVQGDSPRQVRQNLRDDGLAPTRVEEVREGGGGRRRRYVGRVGATELALFTRQLATLVRCGTPLDQALATVAEQTERPRMRRIVMGVRARVTEGFSLATGLDEFPRVFPEMYRATVAAGEESGHLEAVLERLADYAETRQVTQQRVASALIYPVLLTGVAVTVVAALLGYVVPKVVGVFASLGQQLPWITRALIAVSGAVKAGWIPTLILLVVAAVVFTRMLRRESVRLRFDAALLRLPLFGRLGRGINAARFARTLSILNGAGVPILDALRIAGQVLPNRALRAAVEEAAVKVREGTAISAALRESGRFPPLTVHLIASGEVSGNLDQMLERAAMQQERESDATITTALSLFEPALILLMGAVVLVIVLAILLPIFELNQLVR